MNRLARCLCLLALAAVVPSFAAAQVDSRASGDEAAIRAARVEQNRAIVANQPDQIAEWWTDDVTIRASLGRTLAGREEYRAAFAGDSAVVYVRTTTQVELSARWPLAWEEGTWEGRRRDSGETVISGRYAAQWVKTAAGWRIRSELFVGLQCAGQACGWPVVP